MNAIGEHWRIYFNIKKEEVYMAYYFQDVPDSKQRVWKIGLLSDTEIMQSFGIYLLVFRSMHKDKLNYLEVNAERENDKLKITDIAIKHGATQPDQEDNQ